MTSSESGPAPPPRLATPVSVAPPGVRRSGKDRGAYDRRLVTGPLLPAVLRLAWPAVLQNLLLGLQGVVSHVVAGRAVGFTANAALGLGWQIFLVVLVFFSSLYTGMSIVVARLAGAGDAERVNHVVFQALITTVLLGLVVVAPVGYVAAPALLTLLQDDPEVRAAALPYLRIMFGLGLGNMVVFMVGGALRAVGDARTPFWLAVLLTTLNVTLNVILIPGWGPLPALGAAGAAVGTVAAGGITAIVAIALLASGRLPLQAPHDLSWTIDWRIVGSLCRFGLPAGLQGIATALGGVLLVGFVGSLEHSGEAQAVYAVGYTQLFSLVTWTSLGLMSAASVMAGQNLGAGRPDRVVASASIAAMTGGITSGLTALLFVAAPGGLLRLFGLTDPLTLALGVELLRYLGLAAVFFAVGLVYSGALQGTGDTRGPLWIAVISLIGLPLVLCATVQYLGDLQPRDIWMAIVFGNLLRCALAWTRFRRGRWRSIELTGAAEPAVTPART